MWSFYLQKWKGICFILSGFGNGLSHCFYWSFEIKWPKFFVTYVVDQKTRVLFITSPVGTYHCRLLTVILNDWSRGEQLILKDWSRGQQWILFPENLNVSRDEVEIRATTSGHLRSRITAVNVSRVTVNCFPFDVIVFAMLPAHGIWRETVSLLDVMWPWSSQWMGAL